MAKTSVFAGMVIHNPKVGGSIPPPPLPIKLLPLSNLLTSSDGIAGSMQGGWVKLMALTIIDGNKLVLQYFPYPKRVAG